MPGSGRWRGLALALAASCLLIASCGGSSSSTQSTAKPAPAGPPAVGAPVRMRAGETTLVVTVSRLTFPLRGSGAMLPSGDRAAGVDVTVRNAGHGAYDSSSESDVSLRTSGGDQAEPAFASHGSCITSEIDFLKEVEPGEVRHGCVAFDLPKGTKPVIVRFSPEGRPAGGQDWAVKG